MGRRRWPAAWRAPVYRDRADAGAVLADAVAERVAGREAVVAGLARGGVEVAAEIAGRIGAPLTAVATRKVGHPLQPEYALGAVTPDGPAYLRAEEVLAPGELERCVARAAAAARDLEERLRGGEPPPDLRGRVVVLADDGLATGATMLAAVGWARAHGAAEVIAAAPVGSPEAVELVAAAADAVVCPLTPSDLRAVSLWFEEFPQIEDVRVRELLGRAPEDRRSRRD